MPATYKKTSRYYNTPVKDFYLDLWNPITISPSPDDQEIVLESRYDERPDLLSYDLYGTPRLWWVFALRNMDLLVDPIKDFKAGYVIYAPTSKAVEIFK